MAKSRRDPLPDALFEARLWLCTPKQLQQGITDYLEETAKFDPNNFAELHFHLFRDEPKYAHKVNLCKIAQVMDVCKRCSLANTKDCHLMVPYVSKDQAGISERLLNLVKDNCELFTSDKESYARFYIHEHLEIHPVKSKAFSRYLAYQLYKNEGKPPNSEAIGNAVNVLSAVAHFEGEIHQLQNRVAWHNGAIYFDLSNESNQVVRISADGWEILDHTKVPLFHRYNHQRASELPLKLDSEDAETLHRELFYLLDFLNHDHTDEAIRLLIIIVIVSYFIPEIPHPSLMVFGAHGSAKSTFFQVVKNLVDPSKLGTQSFPKGIDNLVQGLFHQWFIGYDNVGDLPDWLSDYLCRAVTGEGFLKREIYTVEDDVIFTYKRCVGLNGINNAATKPDLLDRSILINLPRISEERRISEEDFWISFREAKPRLLGCIFTILSKAMKIKSQLQLSGLYRLADWTKWGAAIAESIGIDSQHFLNAYGSNRDIQTHEALDNSDLGTVVMQFIQEHGSWAGSMTALYSELIPQAERLNISTKGENWPKSPNALSRKLKTLEETLKELGVNVTRNRSTRIRGIEFEYVGNQRPNNIRAGQGSIEDFIDTDIDNSVMDTVIGLMPSDASTGQNDDNDGNDDILPTTASGIPKDKMRSSRGVKVYEKRWQTFLARTADFSPKHKFTLLDIDKLYPDEKERAQVQRDLKDWTQEGRLWKLHSKGEEGWRVSERGSVDKDGGIKL